jgi:serine-type D-Ala-D-Ala carboxypeptidase (penicillin-binding protein 5/6)
MLTSLLSFYIATTLNNEIMKPHTAQLASISFTNTVIEKSKTPIKNPQYISPIINAKGAISMDFETGEILHGQNIHSRMPIASITKIMTILIILEENDLEEVVTVSSNAANTSGSTMHLRSGEKITVKNLIHGALIGSGNDAAVALAEHNAESVNNFVAKMNRRSAELGLINTQFQNPIGFDHPNNYSSPHDIAKLAKFIYNNDFIKESAKIKNLTVRSVNGNNVHKLESTNELLGGYLNVKGLKTGRTQGAGLCLVTIAESEEGNEIITVVLDSPARFKESKILTDWTFRAYKWH